MAVGTPAHLRGSVGGDVRFNDMEPQPLSVMPLVERWNAGSPNLS